MVLLLLLYPFPLFAGKFQGWPRATAYIMRLPELSHSECIVSMRDDEAPSASSSGLSAVIDEVIPVVRVPIEWLDAGAMKMYHTNRKQAAARYQCGSS